MTNIPHNMNIKLKCAFLIEWFTRKLRFNPSSDYEIIKKYRHLINYHRQINLDGALNYFSIHQTDEVNLQGLAHEVAAAKTALRCIQITLKDLPNGEHTIPKIIWMYWNRGLNSAPDLVRLAYQSWVTLNPDYEVRFLDDNSIRQYVDTEQLFKISSVELTVAHKSDFIRTYLLATQGGIWADSTTFCWQPLDNWLADETRDSGFFVFRQPDERKDRQITNWFIASSRNNPITTMMLGALCNYLFKSREVVLTMRKPRHYARYNHISRTETGYHLLHAMEYKNTYPYFFYHYLFNEVVRKPVAREIWQEVITARNSHVKNQGEIGDALVSKQTYKGEYPESDTYLSRKKMLLDLLDKVTR